VANVIKKLLLLADATEFYVTTCALTET